MRLSVKKYDEGYRKDAFKYQVYLNNKILNDCYTVDTKENKAWVHQRDPFGNIMINHDRTDIISYCIFGKIKLKKMIY